MNLYVVKKWDVNPDQGTVNISGRASGLIAWVLSLLRINPIVSIHIDQDIFEFEEASFTGITRRTIPINKISSVFYGYTRPWIKAIVIFVVTGGIVSLFGDSGIVYFIALVLALAAAIVYYLSNKVLTLGIVEVSGGIKSGLKIKRSIIEGHDVDEKDAEQVSDILYRHILAKN